MAVHSQLPQTYRNSESSEIYLKRKDTTENGLFTHPLEKRSRGDKSIIDASNNLHTKYTTYMNSKQADTRLPNAGPTLTIIAPDDKDIPADIPCIKDIKREPPDYVANGHPVITVDSGYSSSETVSPEPQSPVFVINNMDNVSQIVSNTLLSRSQGRKLEKECCVCGEMASGNFFGAVVCLPCKTFFIRCSTEDVSQYKCRIGSGKCDVTGSSRSHCKYCRYKKCVENNMNRRERPEQVELQDGQELCSICEDVANGTHFGVVSCEGCKKFFRRGLKECQTYICKYKKICAINPRTRNICRYCRFQKCLMVGMSTSAIRMGRPKKTTPEKQQISEQMPPGFPTRTSATISDVNTSFNYRESRHCDLQLASSMKSIPVTMVQNNCNFDNMQGYNHSHTPLDITVSQKQQHNKCESPVGSEDSNVSFHQVDISPESANRILVENKYQSRNIANSEHLWCLLKSPPGRGTSNGMTVNHMKYKSGEYDNDDIRLKSTQEASEDTLHKNQDIKAGDKQDKQQVLNYGVNDSNSISLNQTSGCYHQGTSEEPLDITSQLASSYLELVETFCTDHSSRPCDPDEDEDSPEKHLIPHISKVIKFIKDIPGMSQLDERDKCTIMQLASVQVSIVLASIHLYNPMTNSFLKPFFGNTVSPGNPGYQYKKMLLIFAKSLHFLGLDSIEASFMCGLLSIDTEWPNLRDVHSVAGCKKNLKEAFESYINVKYGEESDRITKIFDLIPALRKLGCWHYNYSAEKQ